MKISFPSPQMNFWQMKNVGQAVKQQMQMQRFSQNETIAKNLKETLARHAPYVATDTSWQKIVPVSNAVKKELLDVVEKSFRERGGMSGENSRYNEIVNDYVANLPPKEAQAAVFTLSEIFTGEASHVRDLIKEKDPTWDFGRPVQKEILDDIFGKSGQSPANRLDKRI